jgi:hypothetical protein
MASFDDFGLLTLSGVAELLHCSKAHVSNVIGGRVPGCPPIPAVGLGRRKLVRREALRAWIEPPLSVLRSRYRQIGVPRNALEENSMRSKRYQTGGIKKQRGRWIGMWWVDGKRKSRMLGLIKTMSKTQAREAIRVIVDAENAKRQQNRKWRFGEFVEQIFPFITAGKKDSTRDNNVNRVSVHLVAVFRERELSTFQRDELQDVLYAMTARSLS